MDKLKTKIKSLQYLFPIIWKTIKFRIIVWWHKNIKN